MILLGSTFVIDRISLRISGPTPQRFLSLAALENIRLWHVRCTEGGGYAAMARGVDLAALEALAVRGEWQITLLKRQGPGPLAERALRRPGVPIGLLLFLVLLRFLGSYVWSIDFGTLEVDEQAALRTLLAENGLYEGARPDAVTLSSVRRQAAAQSGRYGWVSINFTEGCLAVESSPSRFEVISPPVPEAALYAAAEGKVLRVETKSGFSLVAPGHYVAKNQLLVDCVRTRRSGVPFTQGASGAVIARVVRSYTATQPLIVTASVPSVARVESLSLHFMAQKIQLEGVSPAPHEASLVERLPLRVGRVSLPGYLLRTTQWPRWTATLHYSMAQAADLAARACRLQLLAEFPDAVIETQQRSDNVTETVAHCTLIYTFCANIAKPK